MILKVNNEFLEFNGEIEIERKTKLFEDISLNSGDFSYEFEIPNTSTNRRILGIEDVNIVDKLVYLDTSTELISDNGQIIYYGFLKIGSISENINASFFSGNSNWISKLPVDLRDVNLTKYDRSFEDTLAPPLLRDANDGVVFPLFDAGLLSLRNSAVLNFDDFVPWIYVKTVVQQIFTQSGIKITGEILKDPIYDKLIISKGSNEWYQSFINDRSAFVSKTSNQTLSSGDTVILDKETFPNYKGLNFDTGTYLYSADVDMTLKVVLNYTITSGTGELSLRGTPTSIIPAASSFIRDANNYTVTWDEIKIKAGQTIDVAAQTGLSFTITTKTSVNITPIKFVKSYANSILPDWTTGQFLDEVFKLFNVVIDYDEVSNSLEVNLFKNIKDKAPQDLSNYISSITRTDYFEFIDSYGKINNFQYQSLDTDEAKDYERRNGVPFGSGQIELDNSYIQESVDVVDSAFTPLINVNNEILNASLAKAEFIQASEDETISVTSVTDVSGKARFDCASAHLLKIGTLVRLKDFTSYSGDGIVESTPTSTTFILVNINFVANETGNLIKLLVGFQDSDIHLGLFLQKYATSNLGIVSGYKIHNGQNAQTYTRAHYVWFSKPGVGSPVDDVNGDLSFGRVNLSNYNSKTNMINSYFSEFRNVLNDPIKIFCEMYLPETVFRNLTFSRPVRVSSIDANSLFYLNRISGYKGSHLPCEVELIKLS
jgi:hypothetical protein